MRPRDLIALVEGQQSRLEASFKASDIEKICSQHRDLKLRYEQQARFKSALTRSAGSITTTFDEAWKVENLATNYPQLCAFAGGFASIFPNTATVESDFSSLKWEKDEFRHSLTDFSLEGILHCRQALHETK